MNFVQILVNLNMFENGTLLQILKFFQLFHTHTNVFNDTRYNLCG